MIEKSYLSTDKNIYAPNDTIWFKSYVFDETNKLSDQSISFKLGLGTNQGEKLHESSWQIIEGTAEGWLLAPREEGQYVLLAFSGQMIGASADTAFTKRFYVRSELVDEVLVTANQIEPITIAERVLKLDITSMINRNKPSAKLRLKYELVSSNGLEKTGRMRTDEEGKLAFELDKFPLGLSDPRILISSEDKSLTRAINLTLPIEVEQQPIDLQFFPEGGHLIQGVANNLAFKAMSGPQETIDITMVIKTMQGEIVDTVSSYYKGMGQFSLIPGSQELQAQIISPFQLEGLYKLPIAKEQGVAISLVKQPETKELIRLIPSSGARGTDFVLELNQFSNPLIRLNVKLDHRQFLELPTELLASGLARATLYTKEGEPLAERLFFHHGDKEIDFKLTFDKASYGPREEVKVKIEASDRNGNPVKSNFSFSAIDFDRTRGPADDTPNLMTHMLLTSELVGHIPTPNFYFSDAPKAMEALNLVTLTNGWRKLVPSRFDDPEAISGSILFNNNKRKKIGDKPINVMDLQTFNIESFAFDKDKTFEIPSSFLKYKGDSILISSVTKNKKDRFSIQLNDSSRIASIDLFKTLTSKFKDKLIKDKLYYPQYKLAEDRFNNVLLLNSVTVESNSLDFGTCKIADFQFEKPWKTKLVDELDLSNNSIRNQILMFDRTINRIGDLRAMSRIGSGIAAEDVLISSNTRRAGSGSLGFKFEVPIEVFINCEKIPFIKYTTPPYDFQVGKTLDAIDFSNLKAISYKRSDSDFELSQLMIYTEKEEIIYKPTFRKHRVIKPFEDYTREFYAPKYITKKQRNDPVPDLRTTLFWQANVVTDEKGEAEISFYNADRPNRIQVTVEGVDTQSRIGFSQIIYQVNEKQDN
ncbi:hypothetical protein [Roseivirga sp. 4D4]|uniref:hypothetical protein n=1 Tax=Roseivirga sp. 4D4 TaxID=1889784 RepID=UPI001C885029|nr:hypothetical protein [Roseivirga sp. 4D4]